MQAEIAQGRLVAVPLRAPELVRPVGIVHQRRKQLNRELNGSTHHRDTEKAQARETTELNHFHLICLPVFSVSLW